MLVFLILVMVLVLICLCSIIFLVKKRFNGKAKIKLAFGNFFKFSVSVDKTNKAKGP